MNTRKIFKPYRAGGWKIRLNRRKMISDYYSMRREGLYFRSRDMWSINEMLDRVDHRDSPAYLEALKASAKRGAAMLSKTLRQSAN